MFSNIVLSVTVRLLRSLLRLTRDIALSASSSSSSEISSGIVSSESSRLVWVCRLGLINEGDDRGKVVSLEVSGCVIEAGPAAEDGGEIKVGGCAIEAGLGSDDMCPSETVETNKSSYVSGPQRHRDGLKCGVKTMEIFNLPHVKRAGSLELK